MAQPTQTDPQFKLRLPAALKERIESAASANNRSMNAEIVAALENTYPSPIPAPFYYPHSSLGMLSVHWRSDNWAFIDWDSWERLKSGELYLVDHHEFPLGNNFFVTAVIDGKGKLCNLIVNHLIIREQGYEDAGFNLLDQYDKANYLRIMTSATSNPNDDRAIKELREKMLPAYKLPDASVPKLKEVLRSLAEPYEVDRLLKLR